jgi:DNA-binding NarL/FixJ family response regulator
LRQAGIARLLQAWADVMGFTVNAVLPDALPDSNNYAMTIVKLGDTSIEDAQCHVLLENVRRLMSNASLIIISDREDLHEVCAAFHEGARGFMPTTIEPRLAFQALSFIDGGGTFFPPPVLSCFDEVPVHKPVYDSVLTVKQEEVLALVRQGHSNKVIAHRLGLSEATVKLHAHHIMQKFRVANRTQLAIAAINHTSSPEAPITLRGSCARAGDTHTATPLRLVCGGQGRSPVPCRPVPAPVAGPWR